MKIGKIELPLGLMLAPMAGVSDRAFRLICRTYGAELCFTEMISAKAVHYGDPKTAALAHVEPDEAPCIPQLFGAEPGLMAESTAALLRSSKNGLCAVDINMGCPVRKIVSNHEGSALMKNPSLAGEIIRRTVEAAEFVSVKIRTGWDEQSKNAVEFAVMAEACGAGMITVHGRTRSQMYAPPVDLETIRQVKKAVKIPVIGNGGVFCAEDAIKMLDYTGCDGVMVARGAMGNPFIFAEIKAALQAKTYVPPAPEQRLQAAVKQFQWMLADKDAKMAVPEFRKHAAWYTKGLRGGAEIRNKINHAVTPEEMIGLLHQMV